MRKLYKKLNVVILAAGKGNRMASSIPKVLHKLAGKSMIQRIIDTVSHLNAKKNYLIYGYRGDLLQKNIVCQKIHINWVKQNKPNGTGHAVQQIVSSVQKNENVLILYADMPLVSLETINRLLIAKPKNGISILTGIYKKPPKEYGRIIRNNGKISKIIEYEDANCNQKKIKEINTGVLVVNSNDLKRWINQIKNNNAQNEFYLTDIIQMAWKEGVDIISIQPNKLIETKGVNNQLQLANLERLFQEQIAKSLLLKGVMLKDPKRFDLRGELTHGKDILIDTNVIFEGKIILGDRVTIGSGCILKNVVVENEVVINPYSVIEDTKLSSKSVIGPFARLRPGSQLDEGSYVGNFVETKNTYVGKKSKVGHLSYLGDANIGSKVVIGAGTITCNYDGINKHKTIIKDNAFIGSNSQLVAPVTVGIGSVVGAGTTVTNDVDSGEVIISRIRQFSISKKSSAKKKKN